MRDVVHRMNFHKCWDKNEKVHWQQKKSWLLWCFEWRHLVMVNWNCEILLWSNSCCDGSQLLFHQSTLLLVLSKIAKNYDLVRWTNSTLNRQRNWIKIQSDFKTMNIETHFPTNQVRIVSKKKWMSAICIKQRTTNEQEESSA